MSAHSEDWTYHPSEGWVRWQERVCKAERKVQAQIEAVRSDLRFRNEASAADAFEAMLTDEQTHRDLVIALSTFHLERTGSGEKVRQGDLRDMAQELEAEVSELIRLIDRLVSLRSRFDEVPGAPDHSETTRKAYEGLEAVYDLAVVAGDLHRAVIATHGEDVGGPAALSDRLTGDPLDHLADTLGNLWRRHGGDMTGAHLCHFMNLLRAVYEAETGNEDIPERARKRIKKRLRNGT